MRLKSSKNFTNVYQLLILYDSLSDKVWMLSRLKDLLCDFSSQNVCCNRFIFFLATIKKKNRIRHVKCQLFPKFVFILSWVVSQSNIEKKKSDIFSFTTFRWILENCLMPRNISWPVHVHIYLSFPCNVLSATQRWVFFFFFFFFPFLP